VYRRIFFLSVVDYFPVIHSGACVHQSSIFRVVVCYVLLVIQLLIMNGFFLSVMGFFLCVMVYTVQ